MPRITTVVADLKWLRQMCGNDVSRLVLDYYNYQDWIAHSIEDLFQEVNHKDCLVPQPEFEDDYEYNYGVELKESYVDHWICEEDSTRLYLTFVITQPHKSKSTRYYHVTSIIYREETNNYDDIDSEYSLNPLERLLNINGPIKTNPAIHGNAFSTMIFYLLRKLDKERKYICNSSNDIIKICRLASILLKRLDVKEVKAVKIIHDIAKLDR